MSLVCLILAAVVGAHGRTRGRGRDVSPSPPPYPAVDADKLTVLLAPAEAGTFIIRGDPKVQTDVGSSVSFARLVVLVNSAEYDGPELDFNATITYSVDGAERGPAEALHKMREANELQLPPPAGLARGGKRIAMLGWSYESALARNSMCVTIQVEAYWVAYNALGARAAPVERCFSFEVTSVGAKELVRSSSSSSSSRRRGRGGGGSTRESSGPFVRPSPAGMQHAYVYEPNGPARIEIYRDVLLAPSASTSASLIEDEVRVVGAVQFVNPMGSLDNVDNATEWYPLEVRSQGAVRRNPLPEGPPYVRLYSLRTTLWHQPGGQIVSPNSHMRMHVRAVRASGGETTTDFTQQLCTRLNSFACEWSAAEAAPADNAWAGQLAPTQAKCTKPPTYADVERTAREQDAIAPFAPLGRVRSLLRVEYESPGGVFVSCQRDEVRREGAPAERFFIDPFLGLQQVAPWSVRSAHLARYGCNTTESLPADARIPVGELPAESCLGADNYAPEVKWEARADRLYTLIAWNAPTIDKAHSLLHWLVVDIPGSDVAAGVTLQRYVGPLPMRAFEDLELFSIAVYEQPAGATFSTLPIWPALGLGDSLTRAKERLGPAPVSAKLLVEALGLSAGPHAYTWFFTDTDLWVAFALEYVYGDPTAAASVCTFDQVNHIINPVGGYCTNGFYAAPENSAAPFEYLRFDDNGMSAITLDSCAARGFHYPVLERGAPSVNQSAIRSTTVVPSGKTVRRYGRVLIYCDPAKATWRWLGSPFCDGQVFSFPKYEAKVSECDWRQLVPDTGAGSSGRRGHPPYSPGGLTRRHPKGGDEVEEEEIEPCMDAMARCHAVWSEPDVEPYNYKGDACHKALDRCAAVGWQLASELAAVRAALPPAHAGPVSGPLVGALAGLACALVGALVAFAVMSTRAPGRAPPTDGTGAERSATRSGAATSIGMI